MAHLIQPMAIPPMVQMVHLIQPMAIPHMGLMGLHAQPMEIRPIAIDLKINKKRNLDFISS